jgi:hypothetical protein
MQWFINLFITVNM